MSIYFYIDIYLLLHFMHTLNIINHRKGELIMNTLGDRLQALRKNLNLSQVEFSAAFNKHFNTATNQTTISKWENNKEYPRPDYIKCLCKFFNVSTDYLTCYTPYKNVIEEISCDTYLQTHLQELGVFPINETVRIPILGEIKAGYNACANNELLGYEYIQKNSISGKSNCFFLKIKGDSMYPMFLENDLVLIEPMSDVPTGSIAAVLVDNEESTLKRVIKSPDAIILQPLNTSYESRVFTGHELDTLKILGKAIQSIRKF